MQHSPDRDRAGADVGEAFADPAFASLKARGAAFAVVRPDAGEVVWANEAAAAHWGAPDADRLTLALFGPGGRGGWLDGIARGVVPGRAPRLARAGLARGFGMRAHTALIRAWAAPDGTVLMGVAVPDSAPRDGGASDAWRRPAWPAPSVETSTDPMAEPDAGQSLARRSQLAVLRDRLNHAFDGATSLRLLWRTDAAGAVTQVDADSFARLGAPLRFDGTTLPDLVAAVDPLAGARLRDALAGRATWSGLVLALPVAGGAATVPMALSASPIFGPDRAFAGFRGFGILDLGRLELAPVDRSVTLEAAVSLDPPPPAEDAPGAADEAPASPEAEEAPPAEVGPVPQDAPPPQANVVHLRAFQAMASGRFAAPPVPPAGLDEPAPAAAGDQAGPDEAPLSDDLAFLALGEALRARIGAPPRAPDPAPAPLDEMPAPAPSGAGSAPAGDAPARLLDLLPLALLVTVAEGPAFANAAAAARLGHAAPEALLAAGGALVVSQDAAAGAVVLRDADGRAVTLEARGSAISWNGAPATLWLLGEPEPAASPPAAAPQAEEAGAGEAGAGELLDRVDDAVALLDAGGRLRRLNRRGEGWFGREGVLGRSFTELLAPESRAAALTLLDEVRHQRDGLGAPPLHRDVLARTAEAAPVPMLLTLGRLGTSGFYATLRDVTALKRAETERARSEREHTRDVDRLPGLLAKVSHDIRTPLSAILGFAEVMMDERFGPLGNPRYRDYLKDIHASGTRVVALVEDLLDLSRIEAGQLDLDVAAVDVNRIVAETVAQMQPEAHRERVIMRTSLGGRVPAVLADERSARQIVRNLLSNAVKFNEPGGQVIVSTAISDNGSVVLRVRDTGVGMTDDEIAAALEPFGGGASPHPANGNGNGLGLPLTRALVGANGASMAIRSRPREGTLVEVAFAPAVAEDARRPA